MLVLIRPEIREKTTALREQFQKAQPFPHLVVDHFLEASFCQQLLKEFPGFDERLALNEFGNVGRKAVQEQLPKIGPAYRRLDDLLRSAEFLTFLSDITGIPELLYDPAYVGGGTHENLEGQDLDVHVDFNMHPKTHLHRRLNLILFLNPEWQAEWGGCLQLHRDPWGRVEDDQIVTIMPLLNRMAVFETSEVSWHGFRRINLPREKKDLSRRSIAVYFYTRERPEEQVAPSHATIYAPRQLPEQIRAGHTLTSEDELAIRDLLSRRDTQIRFLYEREKEFSEAMEDMRRALRSATYKLACTLTWPLRKVKRSIKGPDAAISGKP
jgi:2OG-Fe(II) oxygenase superfamily